MALIASSNPRIQGLGTATPPYVLEQSEAKTLARHLFAGAFSDIDRLIGVFDSSQIKTRHIARPLDWFATPQSFTNKNRVYREVALEISQQAACRALHQAGIAKKDLGAVVLVSSTGLATPSLDSFLIQRLNLPRSLARVPIWGLGCAGGAAGLARAADLVRALDRSVLLVAVELCSVTFIKGDKSKANLVGSSLFADGAAAVVLGPEGDGPEILGASSRLFDDTEDIMGWDLVHDGLKVRFSRDIPNFLQEHLRPTVGELLEAHNLPLEAIGHFVVHPGGPKVLAAYEDCLDLPAQALKSARGVFRDYGNMSSPTVLFVLERFVGATPRQDAPGMLFALGPGFSAEQVLFKW